MQIRASASELARIVAAAAPTLDVRAAHETALNISARLEQDQEGFVEVGDVARITAECRVDGTLTDPAGIKLVVKPPTEPRFELEYPADVTKIADGRFEATFPCTEVGRWRYQWVATGAAAGAESGVFNVDHEAL